MAGEAFELGGWDGEDDAGEGEAGGAPVAGGGVGEGGADVEDGADDGDRAEEAEDVGEAADGVVAGGVDAVDGVAVGVGVVVGPAGEADGVAGEPLGGGGVVVAGAVAGQAGGGVGEAAGVAERLEGGVGVGGDAAPGVVGEALGDGAGGGVDDEADAAAFVGDQPVGLCTSLGLNRRCSARADFFNQEGEVCSRRRNEVEERRVGWPAVPGYVYVFAAGGVVAYLDETVSGFMVASLDHCRPRRGVTGLGQPFERN